MLAAFSLLPALWRLAIIGSVLLAVAGIYGTWHYTIYTRGYDAAIADIAADNKEAVDAANVLKANRRSCVAGRGTWDQSSGLCR